MPTKVVTIYFYGTPLPGMAGVFTTCHISGYGTDTSGKAATYSKSWESAVIVAPQEVASPNQPLMDQLSLNDTMINYWQYLGDVPGQIFRHIDVLPVWRPGGTNTWQSKGNVAVPEFTALVDALPSFTGMLPESVTINAEFSFTFDTGNTAHADSAFVLLYNNGQVRGSKKVSGAGVVSIPQAAMASFRNNGTWQPLGYNTPDNIIYKGNGYVMVILFNTINKTIQGKRYAFVQQRIVFRVVQFA